MSSFKGRDIIDINDFSKEELWHILKLTKKFDPFFVKRTNKANFYLLTGKIAGLLFFEPSTRTEQSFRSAAQRIGAGLIGFNDPITTSIQKGETFSDTIRIMESYADVLIIRHPKPGSAKEAAETASIPVINAGDGPNQHPTQTILDLYTIWKRFGRLNNLKVALVGNQKHYRTMHALSVALFKFGNNKVYGISPIGLEMPNKFKHKDYIDVPINMSELNQTLKEISPDVVYAGRIPKEYMDGDAKQYTYQINIKTMDSLPQHTIIMHPLPRVDEVDADLDKHPNAIYFQQAKNGLYVREALLALVLGKV